MRGEPDPYTPQRGNPGYHVRRYDLALDYRVASNRLAGRARIWVVADTSLGELALDLVGLSVQKVTVDGARPPRYRHTHGKLRITLGTTLSRGQWVLVEVRYGGQPRPHRDRWGEVGWEELTDGVIVAGQPDGAATWFPCDDHPSGRSSYRIAVTTESPYHVVANGVLVDRRGGASRTTWVYEQDEPMATYLATVQIGRYEEVVLARRPVPVSVLAPPRLRARVAVDLARQVAMLEAFTDLFGPYPFARYTVVVTDDDLEIPLEAAGLAVFGANHLDGRRSHERLLAHELAHQWFGNSLTVSRWQDVWLNEGFACYAEWWWSEVSGGEDADALARRWWRRLARAPQDLVLADPGPDHMFDDRVYKRGALAVHAVRLTLGEAAFREVLRAWVDEHRHDSVSTGDLLDSLASHGGGGLAELLEAWVRRPQLPALPPAGPSRTSTSGSASARSATQET